MSSKLFLWIIVVVNVLLIIRMVTGRRTARPTPLEIGPGAKADSMKKENQAKGGVPAPPPPPQSTYHSSGTAQQATGREGAQATGRESANVWRDEDTGNFENTAVGERSLNCQFVFNGRSYDVFEVLGLPAGSSRNACLRAAVDLRRRRPKDAAFMDALVAAIEAQIPV